MARKKSRKTTKRRTATRTRTTAPRKRKTSRKSKANKALTKVEKFAPPVAGVAAFVGPYAKNAGGLGNVPTAIINDVKNFSANDAVNRLKDKNNQKEIAVPLVGGFVVDVAAKNLMSGTTRKIGRIAGKTAMAYGAGKLAKVVLDPPPTQPIANPAPIAPPSVVDVPIRSNPYETGGYI